MGGGDDFVKGWGSGKRAFRKRTDGDKGGRGWGEGGVKYTLR